MGDEITRRKFLEKAMETALSTLLVSAFTGLVVKETNTLNGARESIAELYATKLEMDHAHLQRIYFGDVTVYPSEETKQRWRMEIKAAYDQCFKPDGGDR